MTLVSRLGLAIAGQLKALATSLHCALGCELREGRREAAARRRAASASRRSISVPIAISARAPPGRETSSCPSSLQHRDLHLAVLVQAEHVLQSLERLDQRLDHVGVEQRRRRTARAGSAAPCPSCAARGTRRGRIGRDRRPHLDHLAVHLADPLRRRAHRSGVRGVRARSSSSLEHQRLQDLPPVLAQRLRAGRWSAPPPSPRAPCCGVRAAAARAVRGRPARQPGASARSSSNSSRYTSRSRVALVWSCSHLNSRADRARGRSGRTRRASRAAPSGSGGSPRGSRAGTRRRCRPARRAGSHPWISSSRSSTRATATSARSSAAIGTCALFQPLLATRSRRRAVAR